MTTSPTAQLEPALTSTGRILDGITNTQWNLPTPCDAWHVRADPAMAYHSAARADLAAWLSSVATDRTSQCPSGPSQERSLRWST